MMSAQRLQPITLFWIFLRLGLTSFGGPIAHLGFFREEFVNRRRWLSEHAYADLVALCQCLPGPASSQVGMAIGLQQGGYWGALAAWLGFTLPSALLMTSLALGLNEYPKLVSTSVLHGLNIVVVAVVAQAVWGMAQSFCRDRRGQTIMLMTACLVLLISSTAMQILSIITAGLLGLMLERINPSQSRPTQSRPPESQQNNPLITAKPKGYGLICLLIFFTLLAGLPLLSHHFPSAVMQIVDGFFRAGSLVFGGGHVVLALLQESFVNPGFSQALTQHLASNRTGLDQDYFLAGYAAAQAMPGPLFSFAAFLGASLPGPLSGWAGGMVGTVAIFTPSFLLVVGTVPYWERLRQQQTIQAALVGVQAAVVGLLLAALVDPIWIHSINSASDVVLLLLAALALIVWRLPAWAVVCAGGLVGYLI